MNIIDTNEMKSLIKTALTEALSERGSRSCIHCGLTAAQHKADHDFLASLIATFQRMNSIKWAVLQALVIGLAITAVTVMGIKLR